MRKAGGLAGVGEGGGGRALPTNKIKTYSVLRHHSVSLFQQNQDLQRFKTSFCRLFSEFIPTKSRLTAF
jgi:hypothetical protein